MKQDEGVPISATARRWLPTAIVVVAPAVLLAGAAYHPDVGDPADADFTATIAAAAASDPSRWGTSHLAVGVGSGLLILAFLALRSHLMAAGENRWSALGLPFIVVGSTLFAMLPALEFAPLAAAEANVDLAGIAAIQDALRPWFVPILLSGAVTFVLGTVGFAIAIARSELLSPGMTRLVVVALVTMAAARLAPFGAALRVGFAIGIVALWPLAYMMWNHPGGRGAR